MASHFEALSNLRVFTVTRVTKPNKWILTWKIHAEEHFILRK